MTAKETMFDRWALQHATVLPLQDLQNSMGEGRPLSIGVDAEHFLRKFAGKEPLNGALGGDPLFLEEKIMTEINQLKKLNCEVVFFFHGCEYGPVTEPFAARNKAVEVSSAAFTKYEEGNPSEAITIFKNNDFPDIAAVTSWFKSVLVRNAITSITAPFSAYAQMVDAFNQGSIDMYYASTEILLFGAGQIITSMDLKVENHKSTSPGGEISVTVNVEASTFRLLDLEILASAHLHVPETYVKDTMLLSGSSKLPVFQPWADLHASSGFSFSDAVNVLNRWDGNIYGLIESSTIDAKSNYWDKYMQVAAAVQFMPVLRHINEVIPGNGQGVPNDLHAVLGLHLPDELNYYLFTGIISPKTLNWLSSGKILIAPPFEGGDDNYKKLVKGSLHTWRRQNYSLLASNLQRYFQRRPVTTQYWFDSSTDTFTDESPAVDRKPLALWRVKDSLILEKASKLKTKPTSLLFAFESLSDDSFTAKTKSPQQSEPDAEPLKSVSEVIGNTIWRSFYVRDYIDKQHQLTAWGKVALVALKASGQDRNQNEAAMLAVELLRAKILSPKAVFQASSKEDDDLRYAEFVAKVMCVGKMVHQSKGYSGPLSRSLLAFHSNVSAVRSSLRDLLEVVLVNLFLWSEGDRSRDDWPELSCELPFQESFSCGLGILMSTYLDQYSRFAADANSADELNRTLKTKMRVYFANIHVEPSLERAKQIWDVLMAAAKASGDLIDQEDRQHFEKMNAWFEKRRPGNPLPNGA